MSKRPAWLGQLEPDDDGTKAVLSLSEVKTTEYSYRGDPLIPTQQVTADSVRCQQLFIFWVSKKVLKRSQLTVVCNLLKKLSTLF